MCIRDRGMTMLSNETVRKLHEMRLGVMAEAFSTQLEDVQFQSVSFEAVSYTHLAPLSYLLYIVLSFLIPSSSGMASASMPIMGPLAQQLGFSPEVMVQILSLIHI